MRSRLFALFVLTLLIAPVTQQSFADEHKDEKGGDCGSDKTASWAAEYCLCLQSEEIVLNNGMSLYYAYRFEEACPGNSCDQKTDVWHFAASNATGLPEYCSDCSGWRNQPKGKGGGKGKPWPDNKPIPFKTKPKHKLFEGFAEFELQARTVTAKVEIVAMPADAQNDIPPRVCACAMEVVPQGQQIAFRIRDVRRVPSHPHCYIATVGQLPCALITKSVIKP